MSDRMSPGEGRESAVEEKTLSMLEQLGASGVFFCAGAAVRAGRVSHTGALRNARLEPLLPLVLITGILIAQGTRAPCLSPYFSGP